MYYIGSDFKSQGAAHPPKIMLVTGRLGIEGNVGIVQSLKADRSYRLRAKVETELTRK